MLKHVHLTTQQYLSNGSRSGTLLPGGGIGSEKSPDTLSLSSSISSSSSSGSSSSTSANQQLSSRCSSTGSLQDHRMYTIPIRVYASVLRSDIEYKTLSVSPQMSSKQLIAMVLNKYRMKHRDPNLFYLTMEVGIRKTGLPIRTLMVLDEESRPAELQSCHPIGHSKFSLQMRRGGLVKVYDSCLMAGSQYKSLLISEQTTVEELMQLLLNCYNSKERSCTFSLYQVSKSKKHERKLHPLDSPLMLQQEWDPMDNCSFHLRRNIDGSIRRKIPWTRSMDVSGHINFRLTLRDEVSPTIIHSPTLKPSYNDYENYFYI